MSTRNLIANLGDSFRRWDTPITTVPTDPEYAAALTKAREHTGWDEAAITGCLNLDGRRVALIAIDPTFLGGSIGVDTASRITAAIERATHELLPLVVLPAGGGTRMQEGTVAFLQMATITQAVMEHKEANLPYLVYQRHPTMGGVFASWASLGHVILAEPGALVGFLGPRVYQALHGEPFPQDVQLSENLQRLGIIDAVVSEDELRPTLTKILNVLMARREHGFFAATYFEDDEPLSETIATTDPDLLPNTPVWDAILTTRDPARLGTGDLLHLAEDVTMLSGTGGGENAPGLLLALARFGDAPCVVLGHCRTGESEHPLGPGALRQARRGLRLARELRLPLVSIIDTQGAALSKEAEEGGLGGEIARCLSEILTQPTPTLSLLLGQGTGGMALASTPADRVLACENAWLAPLPPEGAAAIMFRDPTRAPEIAADQGVDAKSLLRHGIVDLVIREPEDAELFAANVYAVLSSELRDLMTIPRRSRLAARHRRYRELGR